MNHGNLPSSFASAAAGQNSTRDGPRGGRSEGRGSGDWARRDGRAPAGTLTFRRPSSNSLGQATQPSLVADNLLQSPSVDMQARSQAAPVMAADGDRYSKEELLDIYKTTSKSTDSDPSRLFMHGWNPGAMNGTSARGWYKANENQAAHDPGLCWEPSGEITPIGLQAYSMEEREAFTSDINSTVKPPQSKDANHAGGAVNGRKPAHGPAGMNPNPGLTSPSSAARPGTRRREATEPPGSFASLGMMPPTSPRHREESSWFRRAQDVKEAGQEEADEEAAAATANAAPAASTAPNPFARGGLGGIIRSNTTGSAGPPSAGLPSGASNSIWNQTPLTPNTVAPGTTPSIPTVGSFGFFAHQPNSSAATGEKRFGAPRESRLAHLIPNNGTPTMEKPQESPGWPSRIGDVGVDPSRSWKGRARTDTDPFGGGGGGEGNVTGSAALGGSSDSPPQKHAGRGALDTPSKPSPGDFGMSQLALGGPQHGVPDDGPLSPSVTNPYLSPNGGNRRGAGGNDGEDTGSERDHGSNFGGPSRGFGPGGFDAGGDRSQTSSVGPRGYPGTTLGGMSGWPAPSSAGPERGGFVTNFGSIFAPTSGDPTGPGMSAFSPMYGNRAPKMQSLFQPGAMGPQDHHLDDGLGDSIPGLRQTPNLLGAIGRGTFGLPPRENDSPIRTGRFDGFFPPAGDASRPNPIYSATEAATMSGLAAGSTQPTPPAPFAALGAAPGPQYGAVQGGGGGGGGGGEPLQRQMVMPDRMRWTYLDPQGKVQGPFTGCEMHDWYKAQFFTADLRVKKVEDNDFEPLGVMIRRIGNSREPFLVPQVGVAHGPPTQSGPYSPPTSGIIPPLSGVFPAFGRTLTAEEQNNLERRKQEEQYMLAQQRDYQIRQQNMNKMHMGNTPMLQHHSSAHSLHSQPSFGNLAASMSMSPIGQMPMGGNNAAAFGVGAVGQIPGAPGNMDQTEALRDDDAAKWRGDDGQMVGGHMGMRQSDMSLRSQLPRTDELTPDSEGFRDRLREFEQLRTQRDAELAAEAAATTAAVATAAAEASRAEAAPLEQQQRPSTSVSDGSAQSGGSFNRQPTSEGSVHGLSMAQQIQRAQASPMDSGIPMPFPPAADAQIVAPTAQRAWSNLPEQYSRQQSETPELAGAAAAQPPPLAPWAKDPATESQKGPSLKDIQEAEARKAAKAEEIAAAQRKRQAQEQEVVASREREKSMTSQAPGLPTSSTWGSGSPVTTAPAAWTKPPAGANTSAGATTSEKKKTLADIQREEELRKQKSKEIAHQTGAPVATTKSYANLAGKMGPATPHHQPATLALPNANSPLLSSAPSMAAAAAGGGGWSMVGANGKIKIPTGPSAQSRSVSAASVARPVAPKPAAKAATADRPTFDEAQEDFKKSVATQLRKGITDNIDIDTLVETLYTFPLDVTLIADVIYTHSKVMDGRHFAEEFIRRKKLADKGIFDKSSTGAEGEEDDGGDGWNEVVKRGGGSAAQQQSDAGVLGAGFKVVPSRKKGKK